MGVGSLPPDLDPAHIFSVLIATVRNASAVILDREGTVVWCCPRCQWLLGNGGPGSVVGRRLTDLMPRAWGEERAGLARRAIDEGRGFALFSIMWGQRMVCRMIPVKTPSRQLALCVLEHSSGDEMKVSMNKGEGVLSRVNDFGQLDTLTTRELEVLAMLGEGMRPKEIAHRLGRSVSTVDGHRERIGQKLGVHDRADLLLIAQRAALRTEDATAARVRFDQPPRF